MGALHAELGVLCTLTGVKVTWLCTYMNIYAHFAVCITPFKHQNRVTPASGWHGSFLFLPPAIHTELGSRNWTKALWAAVQCTREVHPTADPQWVDLTRGRLPSRGSCGRGVPAQPFLGGRQRLSMVRQSLPGPERRSCGDCMLFSTPGFLRRGLGDWGGRGNGRGQTRRTKLHAVCPQTSGTPQPEDPPTRSGAYPGPQVLSTHLWLTPPPAFNATSSQLPEE